MAKFEVVEVLEDGTTVKVTSLPEFTSGNDAKFHANQMSMMHGKKYQPRRLEDNNGGHSQDWLTSIPLWQFLQSYPEVFSNDMKRARTLFIDPMYDARQKVVRYFSSEETKKRSVSQSIELKTFINRICDLNYRIGSTERNFWIVQTDPNYYDYMELKIVTSPDDIHYVYQNGPSSCMSHHDENYVNGLHPVRLYGDSDFALAYLHAKDNPNRIKARAICCPSRKIYGRIYGNEEALEYALKKEGYHKGFAYEWIGLKFKTEYVEGTFSDPEDNETIEAEGYRSPYIDVFQRVSLEENEETDEKFLVLDAGGKYDACLTSGVAEDDYYHSYECRECGSTYYNGDDEHCWDCRVKLFGIDNSGYPLNSWDHKNCTFTVDHYTGLMTNKISSYVRECKVTGNIYNENYLPTIIGQRYTPNEAKVKFSEHWPVLGNAYLPPSLPVENGGRLHQEVLAAA